MSEHEQSPHRRVRRPLVVKLIGIISLIVLVSMVLVTGLATWFFSEDSRVRAEEQNLTMSEVLAYQVENELRSVYAGALALMDTVREFGADPTIEQIATANYFDRNPEVAYIAVPGEKSFFNPEFFTAWELERGVVNVLLERSELELTQAAEGETVVRNASPLLGLPAALLAVPYRDLGTDNALILVFSTERLQEIVQSGSPHTTFVVTDEGELIAHPEFELVELGVNLSSSPLISEALGSPADTMQIRYRNNEGGDTFGAFRKLGFGRITVASSIPGDMVQEAALAVVRQNLYLTGIVLLLSILAVWFFSKTVSRPAMALVRGAQQIEAGDFELKLTPTTRDELGLLTASFVQMGHGLAERERIKDTFGKFVNKEVAEQALRGRLALGGTRRTATIFFSDIRSFTAISEKLDPEAVVEFLNEYMTLMVDCVERTHGVVDKFIGDAIMAVWGAPLTQGSPEADALLAVKSTLLMRELLLEFNRDRGGPGKPLIRIGCGLNTGDCLAGQIGSAQRMEYTVIGDAVNLASRIEALNKPLGTDILISEHTFELIKNQLIVEPMPPIKVKGKTDPLKIYAVINMHGAAGPQTMPDVRRLLGLSAPQGEVHLDREETKYEILPE